MTLTSKQTLEHLCEQCPERPGRDGLKNLAKGIGWLGIGTLLYCVGYLTVQQRNNGITLADILVPATAVLAGAIVTLKGSYHIVDGATTLMKAGGVYFNNDIYFRNGAFVTMATPSDEFFGQKVTPVDDIGQLQGITIQQGDMVVINGIEITNTDFYTRTEEKISILSLLTGTPVTRKKDVHCLAIEGTIRGKTITCEYVTPDQDAMAKKILEFERIVRERDGKYCVIGLVYPDRNVAIIQSGPAY